MGMLFNNKKAISPLVATILLIAFAVSIGALIMNWSSSEENIPSSLTNSGCSAINLKVLNVCDNNESFVFSLENLGSENIEKIILRSNINGANLDYVVPQSKLLQNSQTSFSVSKEIIRSSNDLELVPVVVSGENELLCRTKIVKQLEVNSC
jgi:flagellin-like protein